MPGSIFPTLTRFSFGEKPLSSSKLNDLIDALNALKVWTSAGDLIYGYDINHLERLAIGSDGQVLSVSGGNPVWATLSDAGKLHTTASSDLSTESTTTATAWQDVANGSVAFTTAKTCTIIAECFGMLAITSAGCSADVRLNLDGAGDTVMVSTSNDYYVPFTLRWIKTGVVAGTHTLKLQFKSTSCGGTAYVCAKGRISVAAFVE